ncbi:hypothetical protein CC85DRAFT_281995 [Cutaneotrichosporon oleaginosum]|uniref:Zn(2)-C6 fungal-type domain-containing protein n=1 Tax=Cutaneotrichosporon oleaginosum TaxID=879819 RepID=A0A0J0XXS2_9TREE|nr:uncharacterized protein CC85DRAFT_281995 [Cutaneotrichosporon oleaginosum]KLT45843.1 hypothetical protein CC85DRAFT_281995 [Cutaneotrichosporon oleaginosum]TXT06547.1 hypothetical protein COLE_05878 [Cutaneotrichosporon oleaginosum]
MPRDMGYGYDQKPDIPQPGPPYPYNPALSVGPSAPYYYPRTDFDYRSYNLDEGVDAATDRPPPLKRGDACLYCRKRRIRCSATKPSCHHCTKLNRECIYDIGKPISRVRKLENRIQELEHHLAAANAALVDANGRAAHAHAHAHAQAQAQSHAARPPVPIGAVDMSNGIHMPYSAPPHPQGPPGPTGPPGPPGGVPAVQPDGPSPPPIQSSTAYSFPPGSIEQSTVDITMLDNFQPAPGMRTMAPRVGQNVPTFAPIQPVHVPPIPGPQPSHPMPARPPPHQPQQPQPSQPQMASQPRPNDFDWDTLDPEFMSMVNQMGETSTSAPPQSVQQSQRFPQTPFSQFGYSQSAAVGAHSGSQTETTTDRSSPPQSEQPTSSYQQYHHGAVLHPGSAAASYAQMPVAAQDITGRVSGAFIEDAEDEEMPGNSSLPPEWTDFDLVGGWYDPNDLPKQARAELLGHFFSNKKTRLSRGYHVPRFMASLDMAPSKRPHPCLVYAMYALVARFSPAPKLKRLEDHFYQIANAQLTNAVKAVDRPFDATRAATILTVYNFSQAHYQAATMMLGQAARLAFSCGLHQIPSSVFQPSRIPTDPNRGRLLGVMRSRAWLLFPPKDAIELGERIWAFWNIYIVDRTGAIGSQQPPSIPDYEVRTPFPKPLYEYELGLTTHKDDFTLNSVDDDVNPPPEMPTDTDAYSTILYIRALALLERASKLMYLPVERDSPVYDNLTPSSMTSDMSGAGNAHDQPRNHTMPEVASVSPSSDIDDYLRYQNYAADNMTMRQMAAAATAKSSMRCARLRTPKAYEKVRRALLRLEADLPLEHRTQWDQWDGHVAMWLYDNPSKEWVTVTFLRGCAWMFLFDVYSYQAENTEAVAVARRLAHTIKALFPQGLAADFDVFISIVWFFISNILIREAKRLQALGDSVGAAEIEADFNIVVEALKVYGKRHDIAKIQVSRAESMREATLDDMEFMKGDGYDNDHRGRVVVDGKTVD